MTESTYSYSLESPVEEAPATVLSLVPSITESLFDLNLGNRLIGRTDYCIYPADKVAYLPSIGGTKNPDIARIIQMRPELVFANYEENRKEDVEALRAAGIPVWVSFPKTLQEMFNLLWNIMYLFDESLMVPRIRLIEQIYDRLLNMSEANEDNLPSVFAPIWLDPLMTFNKDTYIHDLLFVCGAKNVFAERERQFPLEADLGKSEPLAADDPRLQNRDTRYPRITLEEVEVAKPDIILLPSEPYAFNERHIPIFKALDIPAAKHNRIHLVDGSWLTWHGTRAAYALNGLPALLRLD
jgi:ABC-type Fe3+-hydroxamate transport system substrate-binding protein